MAVRLNRLSPDWMKRRMLLVARYSIHDWVELAGAQGVEFLNWMAMRGALTGRVTEVHRNYHIPISNTGAATIVLENDSKMARRAA